MEGRQNPDVFGPTEEFAASAAESTPQADHALPTEPTATPAAAGDAAQIDLSLRDNLFEPKEITVQAGQKVAFSLTNNGAVPHNMRMAGPDGKYNTADDAVSSPDIVPANQTATLEWRAPATPGAIPFQCDIHPGMMTGTITVK